MWPFCSQTVSSVAPFEAPPIVWRLIAALPPILLSAFVSDLGTVSTLAGTCGLTILFVFPVALQVMLTLFYEITFNHITLI